MEPPVITDDFDLEAANAVANAGDTYTTDEKGNPVRDVPRSLEEIEADDEALDARIMASTPSA